jgi:poly-D-alanine transfer protein DltD
MSYIKNGYWNEKKEKLKQKYPDITDNDLSYSEGKERVMLEMLSYKLGKTEQELLYIIVAL